MAIPLIQRVWTSPTLTTWASFAARSLNLALVLPLALLRLSAPEVQIWQMLLSVGSMLLFLDLGLSPTFTRMFARAVAAPGDTDRVGGKDYEQIEQIWRTMFFLYRRAAVAGLLAFAVIGIPAVWKAIHALDEMERGWMSVGIVALSSPFALIGLGYSAYLQGLNHVALTRRWEALASVGAIVSSLLVLLLGGGALLLVLVNQFWVVLAVVRNRMLARQVEDGRARQFAKPTLVATTWKAAWPAVWRSGLGVLLTSGFIQATGVIYAQIGNAVQVSSYMVALRYLTALSQFSQAPFYSKLPTLSRLEATKEVQGLVALAKRGMQLSHNTFAVVAVALAFALPPLLKALASDVPFVESNLWWMLVLGALLERFGAMHLQLYSTTHRIVWHIANGVSGVIMIATSLALLRTLGVYAFPVGTIAGYAGFYCWYCAGLSYKEFKISPLRFELTALGPAVAFLIAGIMAHGILNRSP